MSQAAVDALCELLDLEAIEVNIFRGRSPDEDRQRVFGGQVAGQALVAAARTVDDERSVHSLHAYFLRPGDPTVPILYDVDRIRDGRSFTTRRVVAIQHGRAIFNLQASFHVREEGLDHQLPLSDAMWDSQLPPEPETLPDWRTRMAALRRAVRPLPRPAPAHRHPQRGLVVGPTPRSTATAPAGVATGRRARCPTTPCSTSAW